MAKAGARELTKLRKWPKLLFLGDSQTQKGSSADGCWVSILSDHFSRKCDVINRGFSGYNSRWVKMMLPQLVDSELAGECAAVTLFLGSNDSNLQSINPHQHVPLDEYKESLIDIAQHLVDLGVAKEKMILICPPPVDRELWSETMVKEGRPAEHGMRNEMVAEYAAACLQASKELNVECIDLYTEMMKHEDWKKFVNVDGLHLAKLGGELLSQLLIQKLQKVTDSLIEMFPDWKDVNSVDPAMTFK